MKITKNAWILAGAILFFVVITLFIQFGTTIHESAHALTARAFGCTAASTADLYTGSTKFDCPEGTPTLVFAIVAFAGFLVPFLLGLYFWFGFGKDSFLRLLSIPLWVYSTIPSGFPKLSGSDANYLISIGFPPLMMWLIYIFMTGIVFWLICAEIMERDPLDLKLFKA